MRLKLFITVVVAACFTTNIYAQTIEPVLAYNIQNMVECPTGFVNTQTIAPEDLVEYVRSKNFKSYGFEDGLSIGRPGAGYEGFEYERYTIMTVHFEDNKIKECIYDFKIGSKELAKTAYKTMIMQLKQAGYTDSGATPHGARRLKKDNVVFVVDIAEYTLNSLFYLDVTVCFNVNDDNMLLRRERDLIKKSTGLKAIFMETSMRHSKKINWRAYDYKDNYKTTTEKGSAITIDVEVVDNKNGMSTTMKKFMSAKNRPRIDIDSAEVYIPKKFIRTDKNGTLYLADKYIINAQEREYGTMYYAQKQPIGEGLIYSHTGKERFEPYLIEYNFYLQLNVADPILHKVYYKSKN